MGRHNLSVDTGRAGVRKFHEAILSASGNEAFVSLGPAIAALLDWRARDERRNPALPNDPLSHYKRVHEAVASGDAIRAGEAMTQLLSFDHQHYYSGQLLFVVRQQFTCPINKIIC
jgi:DNA-binding FadR family transcriptional regulator